ncbi:DUF4362 domain-containing protein [Clostridium manihotivorum]|uniref:DUF4362 domain-containing protein n=1 Tax=Clostridium manihotivorum TaxID=2320868 RepID=A0A410DQF1_9CLOT|nr:DUF4362 domain-containing protein [Clostridium manihotivorum]QAA31266.1 hypothetical protein C1I91_06190 [Clostridium manihotivorum]
MKFISKLFKREKPDSIIESTGLIDDKLPVCTFFDNVLLEKPSKLKVVTYSIEGIPGTRNIIYDGNYIKYIFDRFENNKSTHKEYIVNRYVKTKRGEFIHYDLYQDNKFIISMLGYRN